MINIAIVSDIRLYREGIGRILNDINEIKIVGIVESHNDILNLLRNKHLDMALVDMRMIDCYEILSSINQVSENTNIIVIAVPENDDNYMLCVESGIAGYLSKESTIEELVEAIHIVDKGSLYCPCKITQFILKCFKHKNNDKKNNVKLSYPKLLSVLTKREMQIVSLLAKGMSNKQIARTLTIELSTVKNHVHNILAKMGVGSRTQAAYLLQENDLIHQIDH